MQYNPALDGLRAIAVLAVLAFHAGAPLAGGGFVGVDLFFVLSSFLITTILAKEHASTGRIAVARFYWRRALRLYPTLLLLLAGFLIASPYLWPELPAWRYAAMTAFYVTDYTRALIGEPEVLSYTWSLSVEEHFYLVWPLVLPYILRRPNPARWLLMAYLAATAWRIGNYHWLGWETTYFRFDTRLSGLILGSMLAFGVRFQARWVPLAVAGLAAAVATPSFHGSTGLTAMMVLAEWSAAGLVTYAAGRGRGHRVLSCAALAYVGRLSYGLYLWHFPIVYWMREHYSWGTTLAVTGAASLALAALSHHLVDLPLRRLRGASRPSDDSQTAATNAAERAPNV